MILATTTPFTALPVTDLDRARGFYEGVLGLVVDSEIPDQGGIAYKCGDGGLFVYVSAFAGTNKATAAGWELEDFDTALADLRAAGVTFDTFELEGVTWDGDVAVMPEGLGRGVWFHDPDGNILSVSTPLLRPTDATA